MKVEPMGAVGQNREALAVRASVSHEIARLFDLNLASVEAVNSEKEWSGRNKLLFMFGISTSLWLVAGFAFYIWA
jgi:hypothetical protein